MRTESTAAWQDRARARMAELGLTQSQIAERISRSQSTLACWLSGRNIPNLNDIEALAQALEMEPAVLAYGSPAPLHEAGRRILSVLERLPEQEQEKLASVLSHLAGVGSTEN